MDVQLRLMLETPNLEHTLAQCKVTCARLAQNFNVFKMVVFASGAHIGYVLMFVACLQRFEVEIPGQN